MSSPGAGSGAPPLYDGGGARPLTRRQQEYSFSGRILLTAVVILGILAVVFFLLRLLLCQFVARGRGSLAAGVRRSLGRSARHGLDASALAALPVTAYRRKPQQVLGINTSWLFRGVCVCLACVLVSLG